MRVVRILVAVVLPVALSISCGGSDNGPSGVLTCSAAPESGNVPLDVRFSATSQGVKDEDVSYHWTFGDGTAANGANVSRTYLAGGVYEAMVTARNGGQTATCKKTITVGGDLRIDGCSANPDAGARPLDVQFGVNPAGGTGQYGYSWDFGDGGHATARNPKHTYTKNGTYHPHVTVTSGAATAKCSPPVVQVVDGVSLSCSASPLSGSAPLTVAFDAKAKGGTGSYKYMWAFGDGEASSHPSVSHTYQYGGIYDATVRVSSGAEAECHQKIHINGPARPKPTPKPTPTPGGSTPTPTPSGTATPTATPTPTGPCPSTWSVTAAGTPMLFSAAINNASLFPQDTTTYASNCVVKDIRITMHLTTATGFVVVSPTEDYTWPTAMIIVCGGGVGFTGCSMSGLYHFTASAPARGNQIGTSCSDFVFDTTGSILFDEAVVSPPYSGFYQWDPSRTGVGEAWYLNGIAYKFGNTFHHPPDTILECARIDVTTKTVP